MSENNEADVFLGVKTLAELFGLDRAKLANRLTASLGAPDSPKGRFYYSLRAASPIVRQMMAEKVAEGVRLMPEAGQES
jgi:hypothetical protein